MISYHHVYSNVEHVIRDAPTGNLDAYIKNLERVLDAIEFFTQNNPNCLELSQQFVTKNDNYVQIISILVIYLGIMSKLKTVIVCVFRLDIISLT